MSTGARSARRPRWRMRSPPIGYQHGRRDKFTRGFPMVSWVYYWLIAHTTPRLFLVGAVGVTPAALLLLVGYENAVLTLGFSVLAWIAACMLAGLIWSPRLTVEVQAPLRVECGSRFETRYTVTNAGPRSVRDLAVDTLVFSDWMSVRKRSARLALLPRGATERLSAAGHALARGVYSLPALRYDTSFPCGFWRWGRTDKHERFLSVYPRYARLASFEIPLGNRSRQDVSAARELAREALEFHGCREYREGDALRHVHPRSSARVGAPVVKEFQAEGRSRTAILVDTREPGAAARVRARLARQEPLEAALSLAAAICDALSASERVLELLVAGPQVYRFVSAGRVGYLEEVLDILAAVEPGREDPLERLGPLLLGEIREIQSVCLILARWDARREALVRAIEAWGIGLKVLLVEARVRPVPGLPPDVVRLSAGDVLSGEVVSL